MMVMFAVPGKEVLLRFLLGVARQGADRRFVVHVVARGHALLRDGGRRQEGHDPRPVEDHHFVLSED